MDMAMLGLGGTWQKRKHKASQSTQSQHCSYAPSLKKKRRLTQPEWVTTMRFNAGNYGRLKDQQKPTVACQKQESQETAACGMPAIRRLEQVADSFHMDIHKVHRSEVTKE